jgi:hypothetical protein
LDNIEYIHSLDVKVLDMAYEAIDSRRRIYRLEAQLEEALEAGCERNSLRRVLDSLARRFKWDRRQSETQEIK